MYQYEMVTIKHTWVVFEVPLLNVTVVDIIYWYFPVMVLILKVL